MNAWAFAASIGSFSGTAIQFLRTVFDLRANERAVVETWSAVDELLAEVPRRRALRRLRRRLEVRALLKEHPDDLRAYNRIEWTLYGWAVLLMSAALAVAATLTT